ncbi:DNA polymerase III subunit beta [Vagococcus teuberi]|uniref:Beta sliding clamp n=2 Tax=Vagococcus TaxID=2737 RepID=A0A1J0A371_9ENTE|nr:MULTISPECIES: DNA polymerase III subunit beta [Vagococcus]APB30368.1 DNA polymerase III subunit beta [Vagococcus teuberi]OPF87729.1 DNA polymerase III subunit beta [Vagococcus martis]RHH68438.1 DNA polymerase III subunit beta [Vagococcus sp. AM17-17]
MKVTLNRSAFLEELATVQRAISGKTTIPILTGVKLTITESGLTLTGSNADISIETFLNVNNEKANMLIESTGSIVIQARFFNEIIKKLPEQTLTLELIENNQVIITSGKALFNVNGLNAESYPQLPIVDDKTSFKLPARVLNKLISETVFAVSSQESKPILTGVHLTLNNSQLLAVATDSHRLSQRKIELDNVNQVFDVVIPGKSLLELSRSFKDEEELVDISIMDNQILFRTETMNFYSRLLEGNYPDTNRLIPTSFNTEINFNVSNLLSAIDRASLLSHEGRNNIVKLSIDSENVTIYGNSPEIGNVEEKLSYLEVEGEPIVISFNPDYMKASLKSFGDIDITIRFISPIRPFTLQPKDGDIEFIQLITPVRTN